MKYLIYPINFTHAKELLLNYNHSIVVGSKDWNHSIVNTTDINQIKELIDISPENVFISINIFIFEPQIHSLEQYLKQLHDIGVKNIIYNDQSIFMLNKKHNFDFNLYYFPSTTITSYGQIPFYNSIDIKGISLANELFFHELKEIAANKNNMKLFVQAFGNGFIMYSRWKLISNYLDHINNISNFQKDKIYWIKEVQRKYPNQLIETKHGTIMYTGYEICLINKINDLSKIGIDYLIINFNELYDVENANEIIKLFDLALNGSNINIDQISEYCSSKSLSNGFLGNINDLLHLVKEDGCIDEDKNW